MEEFKAKKVIVVVTTYNEKENLPALVPQILEKDKRISVIVVDDSSPDGTGKIAEELSKLYKERVVPIHRKERGVGTALRDGFRRAINLEADIIIQMDADFSHNPFYLSDFVKEIESGAEVVIGSRYAKGGGIASRSGLRNFISRVANFYNHIFLGMWQISDTASGFKAYRRHVLEEIKPEGLVSKGYSIGVENLYRISKKGYKIKEIPIIFSDRNAGNSKMSIFQIFSYMFSVVKLKFSKIYE